MSDNKQYTIKDIAKMAGVSAGTVDRVMHDRSGVSAESKAKVEEILKKINYKPNVFAIGLAAKKPYRISCLIPSFVINDYWHSVALGIDRAAEELRAFNVTVEKVHFNYGDAQSYAAASEKILENMPDGVVIVPNTKDDTMKISRRLFDEDIPFTFIDVNVEGAGAIKYIGQNSFRSGYIAAEILTNQYMRDKDVVLFTSGEEGSRNNEVQMERRVEGFLNYLNEHCDGIRVHRVCLSKDYASDERTLADFFKKNTSVRLGVVFNSRVYQVARFIDENKIPFTGLIGYDLLPENVFYMKKGIVDYLIGQRPGLQGYCGVKSLSDKIVFKRSDEPQQYMPIDILMKDNIDYYVEM